MITDYAIHGEPGLLCPVAQLAGSIGPLDTQSPISNFQTIGANDTPAGMAIMIGDEICKLTIKAGNVIEFQRGCADTIPRAHAAGTLVWFFGLNVAGDGQEYGGTQTIATKVLPSTATGGRVPIGGSPPNDITFSNRFIRPYPPGAVLANAAPWFEPQVIDEITDLTLEWKHRDRIGQADQLVTHNATSVGPEAGTTYIVRVYDESDFLIATYDGIDAETWTYTVEQASEDADTLDLYVPSYLMLHSVRDGWESLDGYRIDFTLTMPDVPFGLGYRLGLALGGVAP